MTSAGTVGLPTAGAGSDFGGAAEPSAGGDRGLKPSAGAGGESPGAGGGETNEAAGNAGDGGAEAGAVTGLLGLQPSLGKLVPSFDPAVTNYSVELPLFVSVLTLTAELGSQTQVTLLGNELTSGVPSEPLALSVYSNELELHVQVADAAPRTYVVRVHRDLGVGSQIMKPIDVGAGGYGMAVSAEADELVVGTLTAVDVYRTAGGKYAFESHLTAKHGHPSDNFGNSVAISGDRLVVGAPFEDSGARGVDGNRDDETSQDSGAAYIYVRKNGVWSEEAYVKASNTGPYDWFGFSVSLRGDWLAVGAPYECGGATNINGQEDDEGAPSSGAVYLFTRGASGWTQVAYVKRPPTASASRAWFGMHVTLADHQLAVGAPNEDVHDPTDVTSDPPLLTGAGAAYVLLEHAGVWEHEARVQASNPGFGDMFGNDVALAGDVLAVGAPYEDSSAQGINGDQSNNDSETSGAAYTFLRTPDGFVQSAYLKPDNSQAGNLFGSNLALSGTTLAVSAWTESRRDGSVYLFGIVNEQWAQMSELVAAWARPNAPDDGLSNTFGMAVALSPRGVIVGAPSERPFPGENGIGTVYCFE